MGLSVTQFVNGKWRQNCYLIANERGDALIVDPGSQAEDLAALIDEHRCRVHAILNTHGHYDHVGAVEPLKRRQAARFYMHGADEPLLRRANLYRMMFESREVIQIPAIDQDVSCLPPKFEVGPFSISWIATPGHTDGSICLLLEDYLFSGDTLMRNAVGRTDLPGGNKEKLQDSIKKLMELPKDMVLCGGHGERSTLKTELSPGSRAWNFLQ